MGNVTAELRARNIDYHIDIDAAPRDREFVPSPEHRVAFTEIRDGTYYICVSSIDK